MPSHHAWHMWWHSTHIRYQDIEHRQLKVYRRPTMPYVNNVSGQRSIEFKAGNALHEGNIFDEAMRVRATATRRRQPYTVNCIMEER